MPTPEESDCTIPPPIPDDALAGLVFKRDLHAEQEVRDYVESQANGEQVTHAELVTQAAALGTLWLGWDVRTDKGRWWVIAPMMNLYSQELFPSLDYTITFHVGLTARINSKAEPGVEPIERAMLAAAWRRWEQAAEALDEAEEAEEFQSVGMRCRECLVAMVRAVATPEMVPPGAAEPKRADVVGWSELVADHVAKGSSAEFVRRYLKSIAKGGWQLVGWLTHASNATAADARMTLDVTHHVLTTFSTALFRHQRGIPDRCPSCGSYKIGLWSATDAQEPMPRCRSCGHAVEPHGSAAP